MARYSRSPLSPPFFRNSFHSSSSFLGLRLFFLSTWIDDGIFASFYQEILFPPKEQLFLNIFSLPFGFSRRSVSAMRRTYMTLCSNSIVVKISLGVTSFTRPYSTHAGPCPFRHNSLPTISIRKILNSPPFPLLSLCILFP